MKNKCFLITNEKKKPIYHYNCKYIFLVALNKRVNKTWTCNKTDIFIPAIQYNCNNTY